MSMAKKGKPGLYYVDSFQETVRRNYELMKITAEKVRDEHKGNYEKENEKRLARLAELKQRLPDLKDKDLETDEREILNIVDYLKKKREEIEQALFGAARIIYRIDRLIDNSETDFDKRKGEVDKIIHRLQEEIKNDPELKKKLGV